MDLFYSLITPKPYKMVLKELLMATAGIRNGLNRSCNNRRITTLSATGWSSISGVPTSILGNPNMIDVWVMQHHIKVNGLPPMIKHWSLLRCDRSVDKIITNRCYKKTLKRLRDTNEQLNDICKQLVDNIPPNPEGFLEIQPQN